MEDSTFDKNLKKAITVEERKHQKSFLRSVENSLEKPRKINWFIAASIAILIGFGGYFIAFNQSLSSNELYDLHFSPYENVVAPIVRSQEKRSQKETVFAYYELGEYQKAIKGFNQLTTQDSIDITTINFYKANAYLQLKEYEKAKPLFAKIIANDNKEWQAESLWYLGLISLKLNEVETAKKHFEALKNQPFKNKEVNDLLDKL